MLRGGWGGVAEECKHWFDNRYTDYLRYLERDLHCGPYCPAKPAPVSLVQEHAAPTRRMKRGGHAAEPLSFLQQALGAFVRELD